MTAPIDPWEMPIVLGYPQRCSEEVSRRGNVEPCDKTAVAVRIDADNDGGYYPVCGYHSRAPMLPLESIVRFLLDRHEAQRAVASGLARMASEETPQRKAVRPLGDDFPCCARRSMSDTPNGLQGRTIAHQSDRSNT